MPTTLSSLMVLVFAIAPGIPGSVIYTMLIGKNHREDTLEKVLKLVVFSLLGLGVYVFLAPPLDAPVPLYLNPESLEKSLKEPATVRATFLALFGHFLGSALVGGVVAGGQIALSKYAPFTPYHDVWSQFVNKSVPNRMVIVMLKDGSVFLGVLETAEMTLQPNERDIILEEPAKYDQDSQNYVALPYAHYLIPGSVIDSIATLSDPSDKRITEVGTFIFEGETDG